MCKQNFEEFMKIERSFDKSRVLSFLDTINIAVKESRITSREYSELLCKKILVKKVEEVV